MMLSEWTAECSLDAPTLVVPWSSEGDENPGGSAPGSHFVDLRANPYDLAEISEAEHNPTLARALRSLNATRSPFLTAKCDTWLLSSARQATLTTLATLATPETLATLAMPETQATLETPETLDTLDTPATLETAENLDTLERLRLELMLSDEDAACGFASYIDLLWRERSVFASAHRQQDRLDRIMRRARRLPHTEAAFECVLRPAFLDLNGPLEGFAITFYLTALGPDPQIARRRWELAMEDIVTLLRGKELEAARGSATIDAATADPLRVHHLG